MLEKTFYSPTLAREQHFTGLILVNTTYRVWVNGEIVYFTDDLRLAQHILHQETEGK